MEFFDKKQDVMDIQLTSYGKHLLSKGLFKPTYYAFSDDGVMYDNLWMSTGSSDTAPLHQESQSSREPRIQENTPRLKAQYTKVGSERSVMWIGAAMPGHFAYEGGSHADIRNVMDLMEFENPQELSDSVFGDYVTEWSTGAESEKLLESKLGTKSYFNNYNPAWNLLLYNGTIKNSSKYYHKNDITVAIPQINCTLIDHVYFLNKDTDPFTSIAEAKNIQSVLNNDGTSDVVDEETQQYLELEAYPSYEGSDSTEMNFFESTNIITPSGEDTGIKMFIVKDFLFLSLEEMNVDFHNENFTYEVFEVTSKTDKEFGEEDLMRMVLSKSTFGAYKHFEHSWGTILRTDDADAVFDIKVDEEIDASLACPLIKKDKKLKKQNIYVSDVFDCVKEKHKHAKQDPYINLPPTDSGEIC